MHRALGEPAVRRHSFRDVRPHAKHSSAAGLQFRFRNGEISFVDVGENHFHALTNKSLGYPKSDAACRAGNDRDFAGKVVLCPLVDITTYAGVLRPQAAVRLESLPASPRSNPR
jgi:hypothetical protein